MRELGYVNGRDFVVEWRFAEGKYDRFPEFGKELAQQGVDVIVLATSAAVRPMQQVTSAIPIVMGYSMDPVGNNFVASLARPGANITGLAGSSDDTSPKQLELLRTVVPNAQRVGFLSNNTAAAMVASVRENIQAAARHLGVSIISVEADNSKDIESAFSVLVNEHAQALVVAPDAFFFSQRRRTAELTLSAGLPSIFSQREYAEAGGLMSYGESLREFLRRAASFVDKIFKGAKPGDLPIEQPTKFNLVINRKTADALGVAIPSQLYIFADEVIE
jgi:putative tryptophan/tyrosine transport system substrate-binding protein